MNLRLADLFTAGQEGRQAARDDQTRKGLAAYLQGDQAAIGQVYQNAPEVAFKAEGMVDERRAAAEDRLGKLSTAFAQSKDPTVYAQWRQVAQGVLGPQAAGMPESLDDPADLDGAIKTATAMAQAYGQGVKDDTPSAIRELQMLQANPELAELDMKRRTAGFDRPQLIQTDQGYAWATPQGASPLNYGQGGGAPSGVDPAAVQRNLAMLGAAPGVQMTSGLRTPERNQQVGGKANSQHLRGTAGDYVVPQAQKAAFIAQAQAAGLQAIDEGDHIHVQQPRGGSAGGRVLPPQKPDDAPKPSEFERKLEIARAMGATDDQLRQMVLGESGGGKPSATQIKLANTAKQKLIDLQAMDEQIAKVDEAFQRIQGSFSAGVGGNYLPTEAGKRFDAAVAVLKTQVRKLTRTPGEGAMSDYESKLAELANPSRGEYEQVTADQLAQLRALVQTTRQGYEALLQDAGGSSSNLPGPSRGPQPGTVEAGYRFKGGNPADQSNWERI